MSPRDQRRHGGAAGDRPGEAGASLIEVLVVLGVLVLVLALALPSFRSAGGNLPALAAARQSASQLRLARSLAMRRAAERDVVVDLTGRQIWIAGETRPVRFARDLRLTASGLTLAGPPGRRIAIRFFPDGSSSGGRLRFERGRQGAEVGVDWITGGVDVRAAR